MSRYTSWAVAAAAVLGVLSGQPGSASATVATYNFDAQAVGNSTPFSITDNGVTASFSSPADPGGFTISGSFFSTLTGNVLLSPGPAGANDIPLDIAFSQPIASISLLFALNGPPANPFDLATNAGGSSSATGTIPAGFNFPEGPLSFSGAPFTAVALDTTAFNFAVDDIVVTTAAVPEPSSWGLVLAGLAALAIFGLPGIVRA